MINSVNPEQKKYKDPLNKTAVVLMSYSNETGTAISEIAPRLGTALWAPTFMYLGADIYDKYKNDKNNYNPSAKRAFKRAIFQGLTTLLALPTVILIGQWLVSPFGRLDKSGISGNAKDAIYRHTKSVIEQAHGNVLKDYASFKDTILKTLQNKINGRQNEQNTLGFVKKLYKRTFTKRYALLEGDNAKILAYAEDNAKKTFDILQALKNNQKNKIPKSVYKKYNEVLPKMKEMYHEADYSFQATRTALKKYQTSRIFKNKLLKTCGGLVALVIFAKPVNDYVDQYIMKKYINPGIDRFSGGDTIKNNKFADFVKESEKFKI